MKTLAARHVLRVDRPDFKRALTMRATLNPHLTQKPFKGGETLLSVGDRVYLGGSLQFPDRSGPVPVLVPGGAPLDHHPMAVRPGVGSAPALPL
jgi:hypothetical protein